MKKISLIGLLAAVVLLCNHCARNPVTGKSQLALISEEQEIAMGREADPQIVAQFGLYEDSALQRFIREKGQQMAAISHRPNIQYTFVTFNFCCHSVASLPTVIFLSPGSGCVDRKVGNSAEPDCCPWRWSVVKKLAIW